MSIINYLSINKNFISGFPGVWLYITNWLVAVTISWAVHVELFPPGAKYSVVAALSL